MKIVTTLTEVLENGEIDADSQLPSVILITELGQSMTSSTPETVAGISTDANNRLKLGTDELLYVSNDFNPDPLTYYLLERGII